MSYSRVESGAGATPGQGKRRKAGQGREAVDPILPEKKRARRRLIGAVALVLAAVIGLPMVLDSEPKPLADDIAIQIPSKDKPQQAKPSPESAKDSGASKVAPKSAPAAPASVPESSVGLPVTAGLDPKEELIEPPSLKSEKTLASPKVQAQAAKPARDTQAAALSERQAVQKASEAPARPEAVKPDSMKPEVRKPEPVKAETPKKPAQEKPAHDRPTATELAAKDEKAAQKSAEKIEKTEKTDEAARARALLDGKTDPKAAATDKDKAGGKYLIQVAALASQEKVLELQTRLRDAGIKSYAQKVVTDSGDRIRIRVGPFASKEEADKVRAKLGKLGLGGTVVPS